MLSFNRTLLIISIILSGCIIPTYTAHISLTPTGQTAQQVQIGHVLMIGTGPVASQVFLDNLSTEMIRSFSIRGVQSEFKFVGKAPQSSPLKFDSLVNGKFDAYLVFKDSDRSVLNMTKEKYEVFTPVATGTGYGNQFLETYRVTLYHKKESLQMIWQGDLKIDFDLANNDRYKKISSLIINDLVKKHILPE